MSWYYAEAGQQRGPVTDAELEDLVKAGTVQPDTLIWRDGMPNWQSYSQVQGGAAPPSAAPLPEDAVVCSSCGRMFGRDEVIKYGDAWVCAACKPAFVQRLKEGVSLPGVLDYATFWTRLGAKVLDLIILWVINALFGFIVGFAASGAVRSGDRLAMQLFLMFVSIAVNLGYGVFFLGKFGATPGKMACKIKVVTPEGERISYGRACGRCLAELLSGMICYIGYIMAGFDAEKRTLHDRICNTRVIKI